MTNPDVVKKQMNNSEECGSTFLILRICLEKYISMALNSPNFTYYLLNNFYDLLPLGDEENQHDKDFLKHHDEDVEDTLAQPRCTLNWLS